MANILFEKSRFKFHLGPWPNGRLANESAYNRTDQLLVSLYRFIGSMLRYLQDYKQQADIE
jgi:hypothetical protein